MKIIIRVDTDDMEKMKKFSDEINSSGTFTIIPFDVVKVYVIKDNGDVIEL